MWWGGVTKPGPQPDIGGWRGRWWNPHGTLGGLHSCVHGGQDLLGPPGLPTLPLPSPKKQTSPVSPQLMPHTPGWVVVLNWGDFVPQGHWATSGDIFDDHGWEEGAAGFQWMEATDAAMHPTVHGASPLSPQRRRLTWPQMPPVLRLRSPPMRVPASPRCLCFPTEPSVFLPPDPWAGDGFPRSLGGGWQSGFWVSEHGDIIVMTTPAGPQWETEGTC